MSRQWDKEENIYGTTAAEEVPGSEKRESAEAIAKAMHLLLCRQRTEKELREKLREKEFSPQAIEAAVRYVSSFGYLDDRRYAEVYLHSRKGKAGRRVIARELREKGVRGEWIDEVLEADDTDEGETIRAILCRRCGEPHPLDEKELRRQVQYLSRKGFSLSDIRKQIRLFGQGKSCDI